MIKFNNQVDLVNPVNGVLAQNGNIRTGKLIGLFIATALFAHQTKRLGDFFAKGESDICKGGNFMGVCTIFSVFNKIFHPFG